MEKEMYKGVIDFLEYRYLNAVETNDMEMKLRIARIL